MRQGKTLDDTALAWLEAQGGRVEMSKSELAQVFGCARSTVYLKLNQLEKMGLIERSRGHVHERISLTAPSTAIEFAHTRSSTISGRIMLLLCFLAVGGADVTMACVGMARMMGLQEEWWGWVPGIAGEITKFGLSAWLQFSWAVISPKLRLGVCAIIGTCMLLDSVAISYVFADKWLGREAKIESKFIATGASIISPTAQAEHVKRLHEERNQLANAVGVALGKRQLVTAATLQERLTASNERIKRAQEELDALTTAYKAAERERELRRAEANNLGYLSSTGLFNPARHAWMLSGIYALVFEFAAVLFLAALVTPAAVPPSRQ